MIEFLQQFLGTIANPQGAFESLPHSASWIAFFQDALRSYKLINLTYYIGGLLLLIALLKTVYDYIQGYRVAQQVVAIGVASFLFAALATPPRDECVKGTGYPCLVEKRLELKQGLRSITYAEEKLDWKNARYDSNTGVYKLTDAPGETNQRQITIKTKDLSHVRYLAYEYPAGFTPVWERIEDFWWSTYATANTALASMVVKYAESANETRDTLFVLIRDVFATSTTKGLIDEVLPYVGITGGVRRAGVAALAGGVSGATDVPLAMLANSVRTMAILIATAPVALILTYHVLAALSGFILYLIIFLAPIFIGLSAIFGLPILSFPARLLVSIFVVPILSSTVLGTSLHLIYQYTDNLRSFVESNTDEDTRDATVADLYADYRDMPTASPILAYYLSQLAAYQLSNLYACMKDGGFLIIDESGKPTYQENPPSPSVDKEVCGQDGVWVKRLMSGGATSYPWSSEAIIESFSRRLPKQVLNIGIPDPDFSKEKFVAELYSIVGLGTAEGSNPSALISPVGRERLARFISKWGVLLNADGLNTNVPDQTVRKFAYELAAQFGIKDKDKFYRAVSFLLLPHAQTATEGYVPSYLDARDNPWSLFWQNMNTTPQNYVTTLRNAKGGVYKNLVTQRDGFASLYLANVISSPNVGNWQVIVSRPSDPNYALTRGLLAYLDRWMVADRLGLDPLKGTGAVGFMAIQTLAFTLVALILALIAMGSVWTLTAQVLGSRAFGGLQELLTGIGPGVGAATAARAQGFRRTIPSQGGQRRG